MDPIWIIIMIGLIVAVILSALFAPRFQPHRRAFNSLREQDYDLAQAEFLRAIDSDSEDITAKYYLSLIYARRDETDLARKHLSDIVRINKYNNEVTKVDVLIKLASLNMQAKLFEQAMENYYSALEYDPYNEIALFQLAFIFLGQGDFEKANEYFGKYQKIEKKDFEALLGSAVACHMEKKYIEAEKLFRRALEVNTSSILARILLAVHLMKNSKYSEAREELRLSLKQKFDGDINNFLQRLWSFLLFMSGEVEDAVEVLEDLKRYYKKKKMREKLPPVLYDLAVLSANGHNWYFASAYFTMVEYFEPNYKELRKALSALDYILNEEDVQAIQTLQQVQQTWEESRLSAYNIFELSGFKSKHGKTGKSRVDNEGVEAPKKTSNDSKTGKKRQEKKGKSITGSNVGSDKNPAIKTVKNSTVDMDTLYSMSFNDFERLIYHVAKKLDLNVQTRLQSYREQDGIDLLCTEKNSGKKLLLVFRRWQETKLGEIELGNLEDFLSQERIPRCYVMVTTGLTSAAAARLEQASKFKVYSFNEIAALLEDLLP